MNTAILLVTWFMIEQAPSSYTVGFTNIDACNAARSALLQDAERLRGQSPAAKAEFRSVGSTNGAAEGAAPVRFAQFPNLSAVCAENPPAITTSGR